MNMKSFSSNMEWNAFQKKLSPLLLSSLVLSTIFLLFILRTSNPFGAIDPKEGLQQSTPLLEHNKTSSPPNSTNSLSTPHSEIHNKSLSPFENRSQEVCDLFAGRWVKEPRGSIYTNLTCPTLPHIRNCGKYGKDQGYVYWKWKPEECELPRFDPKVFLSIVQGKKLAFIGDSLARNQMESLLCLLSQEETPVDIYKDVSDKYQTWYFPSHNFTLMVIWTEFLVVGTERIINGTGTNAFNVHLDRVNPVWAEKLPELQYVVISGGNWFFRKNYIYESGKLIGCVNCKEENLTDFGIGFAIRKVFRTTFQFISRCEECDDLLILLRTYSPSHFEHGSWFTGGYCNRTQPLNDSDLSLHGITWGPRNIQVEEIERVRITEGERKGKKKFELLDVTKAMTVRADGHPGSHFNKNWMKNSNDCLHWCLPGPIDTWNDLLSETLKNNHYFIH